MNLKSGLPFWLIKDGLLHDYHPVTKNMCTEVAILGGGISGALVAYHLSEAGISCIVLDKRSIGLGSTCCSTSLLQFELDLPLHKLKDHIGIEAAVRVYELSYKAIDDIANICKKIKFTEFAKTQSLYIAEYKKDLAGLQTEMNIRNTNNLETKWIDEKQALDFDGLRAPGGILTKQAAIMNAYGYTHALLQYAMQKQASVYDRTEVTKIKHQKNKVTLQTENGFEIVCNKLVYCNGYEALDYFTEFKQKIKIYSTYALASEQGNPQSKSLKEKFILWNTADPYLYMRTTADNRIIVGGRDDPYYNPTQRDKLLPQKTKQLVKDFNKLFPHIELIPEFSWCGSFAAVADGLPCIGPYKPLPNSYYALGYGGNGIVFSELAAQFLIDMLTGKENKDADIFSFERFNH